MKDLKDKEKENKELDVSYFRDNEEEDQFQNRTKQKIINFFEFNTNLTIDNFNEFMNYIGLAEIFNLDSMKKIWETFKDLADNNDILNKNESINAVMELLNYYLSDNQDTESNNESKMISKDDNNKYQTDLNYEIRTNKENENVNPLDNKNNINISFSGENDINESSSSNNNINKRKESSENNNSRKTSNINANSNRVSLVNINENPEKTRNNSFVFLRESNKEFTKITNENIGNNNINLNSDIINSIKSNNNLNKKSGPRHERKITKIFKEFDIETLKQLRRVFSLLDIKNKSSLKLKEIENILKYKFINLSLEEIYFFISNLSYDNNEEKQTNIQALIEKGNININFELYSRAISAMEQKMLGENIEDFNEYINDSFEIKENFTELFETINTLGRESKDYISVLADIFISMRQKYELESHEIISNINLITKKSTNFDSKKKEINSESDSNNDNINFSLAIDSIKKEVAFYFKNFHDKSQDIEIFLKDLNKNFTQIENKINLLKLVSEKYERRINELDNDYKNLFEKYSTTQPIEMDVNADLEKLLEENVYLSNEIEYKNYQIEEQITNIKDREDKIFSLENDIDKIKKLNFDNEKELNKYKRSCEEIQKEYEKLRNDLYEEMINDDFDKNNDNDGYNNDIINKNNSSNSFGKSNSELIRQSVFIKEKLLKEEKEKANKYLEMSYEKLVLYCLNVDKENNKYNSIFSDQENSIKKLEEEVENLNKLLKENSRQNYLLNKENEKLTSKISDIKRESDFNKGFRPSTLLSNRISDLRGTIRQSTNSYSSNNNNSINTSSGLNGNKSTGFFAFDKNKILRNFGKEKNKESLINENNNTSYIKNDFSTMLKESENIFERREDHLNNNNNLRNFGDSIQQYNNIEIQGDFRISTLNNLSENPLSFENNGNKDDNKFRIEKISRDSYDIYNNYNNDNENDNYNHNQDFENKGKSSFSNNEQNYHKNNLNNYIDKQNDFEFEYNNQNEIENENDNYKNKENTNSYNIFEIKNSKDFSINNNEEDSNDNFELKFSNEGRKTLDNEINNSNSPFSFEKDKTSINNDTLQKDNIEFNRNNKTNKYQSIGSKINDDKNLKNENNNISKSNKKSKSNYLNDQSKLFARTFSADSDFFKGKGSIKNKNEETSNINNNDLSRNSSSSMRFDEDNNIYESDIINGDYDFSGKKDKEENQVIVDDIENLEIDENYNKSNLNSNLKSNSNFENNSNSNSIGNAINKIESNSFSNFSNNNDNFKDQKKSSVPLYPKNKNKKKRQISARIIENEEDEEKDEDINEFNNDNDENNYNNNVNENEDNQIISSFNQPGHNRNYTVDLDKEFPKPSNAIYILRPYDVTEKLRIPLRQITKITISNKNCNLVVFHFANTDDMMVEILKRMELLYFFRDLFKMKSLGKLRLRYSDNFKIKQGGVIKNITIDQSNNLFIAPNFENAQKCSYIEKLCGGFFARFKEKLVVLTNIGLMYFNDPKEPPRKLIPIIGSEINTVDEKKYSKKNCFQIKTLNNDIYVFAVKTKDDLDSWIKEFKSFKVNYQKMLKGVDNKNITNDKQGKFIKKKSN